MKTIPSILRRNLVIIDGNNMCWRGFKRTVLTSSNGKGVDLVFMSLRMLLSYFSLAQENGDMVIVWDGGRDKRRLELFAEYKHRKKPYTESEKRDFEEYKRQQYIFKELISKMGITQILCGGREADDVINTIVRKRNIYSPILLCNIGEFGEAVLVESTRSYNGTIYIVSNDLDYSQLLECPDVLWYNPNSSVAMSKDDVYRTYGFLPEEYPLYKAIVGGHDNVPGVHGVGPVIAKKYLKYLREGSEIDFSKMGKVMSDLSSAVFLGVVSEAMEISKFLEVPDLELSEGVTIPFLYGRNVIEYGRYVRSLLEDLEFTSIIDRFQEVVQPLYDSVSALIHSLDSNDKLFGGE